jgi:hypothetical protein
MSSDLNPYEATSVSSRAESKKAPEAVRRARFAISMWVCGVSGIAFMPGLAQPEAWGDQVVPFSMHLAWVGSFCCSVASILSACFLFSLPRIMDKIGAIFCILLVGFWPCMFAIQWWLYFALAGRS